MWAHPLTPTSPFLSLDTKVYGNDKKTLEDGANNNFFRYKVFDQVLYTGFSMGCTGSSMEAYVADV